MAYDIYTYGTGEILHGVFNAIAMCLKKDSLYDSLVYVGVLSGGMWAVLYAIFRDIKHLFGAWIVPLVAFNTLLFKPTATVWIHDPVKNYHQPVSNVPYGLAVFASYTSRIGYGITEQIEKIFNLPDNIRYQKTGHVFASSLMEKAKMFRITNEDISDNMRRFVGHCVAYDVMLGRKYTIQELRNSDDIWGLISAKASPVRHFVWQEPKEEGKDRTRPDIITCKAGVTKFNQLWGGEIDRAATIFGKKIFGKNGIINPKTELLSSLPIVYGELGNMAKSASDIMKQQMMISSIVDGIDQYSTALGNASNFAARRAYLQQRSTYETIGMNAGDTIAAMKSVLECITYSFFIFIVPLVLLPFGWTFLFRWGQTVLWLQMWAPMYAILNYIMTMAAKSKTVAALSMSNEAGVTIASSVGVANVNGDISAMAGYLAMSIPFLCIAIVKGVGSFVNMASHLGNVSQGAASMAAGEATSGNYSFGNITEGGIQIANTSTFQQSTGASYRSGSFHLSDGRTDMITAADGSQILNVASSNLPVSLNIAETQSAQLSEMQNQTYQQGISNMQASSNNLSQSLRQSLALSESLRNSSSMGDTVSQGISTEQSNSLGKGYQYMKDFSEKHGIDVKHAADLFAEASAGGGVFLRGSAGGRISANSSDQNALEEAEKIVQSQEYQQAMRESSQAAKNISHTATDERTKNLAADVANSYEQGMQQRQEATKNFSESESYGRQAMMTKANSASINSNHTQQFVEWLANQKADNANGPMGKQHVGYLMAHRPDLVEGYAKMYMKQQRVAPVSPVSASSSSIKQGYDSSAESQSIPAIGGSGGSTMNTGHWQTVKPRTYLNYQDAGSLKDVSLLPQNVGDTPSRGDAFRQETERKIEDNQQSIQQGQATIHDKGEAIKQNVQSEQGKSVAIRAAVRAANEVADTAKQAGKILPEPTDGDKKPQFLKDLD